LTLNNTATQFRQQFTNKVDKNASTYPKVAAHWLNEVLCFVSSSVVADSFRPRNRKLLGAANRYEQDYYYYKQKLNYGRGFASTINIITNHSLNCHPEWSAALSLPKCRGAITQPTLPNENPIQILTFLNPFFRLCTTCLGIAYRCRR
jgi:hypothetical protein